MNEKMVIIPINLKQANEFVLAHHRHNTKVVGCKFCIGLWADNELCGVAQNYMVRVAVLLVKWGIRKLLLTF